MEQNNLFVPEWNNPTSQERNDIVFEDKNKKYGAFILRKNYSRNLIIGFILTAFLITSFSMIPLIQAWMKPEKVRKPKPQPKIVITDIEKIPDEPEPEKQQEEIPKIATVQATELAPSETPEESTTTNFDGMNPGNENREGKDGEIWTNDYTGGESITEDTDPRKFTKIERKPKFSVAIEKFIEGILEYPAYEFENNIQGTVVVSFVVGADGKIKDVKTVQKLSPGCDQEAIRVIKALPKAKPALQNGNPVSYTMSVPISFSINE